MRVGQTFQSMPKENERYLQKVAFPCFLAMNLPLYGVAKVYDDYPLEREQEQIVLKKESSVWRSI